MSMAAAPAADAAAGRLAASKGAPAAAGAAAAGEQGKKAAPAKTSPGNSGPGAKGAKGRPRAVAWAWSGSRRLLMAEFLLCTVVLLLGTLTSDPEDGKSAAPRAMVKGSAFALVFFLLALLGSGGKGPAKAATAVGTLVTVAYTMTSSDVHTLVTWIGKFFAGAGKKFPAPEEAAAEAADRQNRPPFPGVSA